MLKYLSNIPKNLHLFGSNLFTPALVRPLATQPRHIGTHSQMSGAPDGPFLGKVPQNYFEPAAVNLSTSLVTHAVVPRSQGPGVDRYLGFNTKTTDLRRSFLPRIFDFLAESGSLHTGEKCRWLNKLGLAPSYQR
jgi:hypothetical protein